MIENPDSRDMDAPHLLYVAWGYPPARSAGMYRALATANAFARNGWRVTVLTATTETFERLIGTDPQSEGAIDPSIEVVRIPFDPQRGETNLSQWSVLRVYSPLFWNASRWLRALASFPEVAYGSWKVPLQRAAEAIHRKDAVDLVLSTANPNVDFAAADHLHKKYNVPYVMDHRDAWHLNVYTGRRVGSPWRRSNRLERRLLEGCMEAWFVNAPIRDWHVAEYPKRARDFHVVANGFDTQFVAARRERLPDPAQLVFGYLGTIYGPIPLREALEGWKLARTKSPLVASAKLVFRGRLGHFAEADSVAAELLKEYEPEAVTYEGPVSKTQVSEVYSTFDALLLIISKSPYVTSGKVFEYASTGLPIVALHDPITAASTVLQGHPLWFPAEKVSAEAFSVAIVQAAEAASTMGPRDLELAQAWAEPLSREAQLTPRIAALRKMIEGPVR